MCSILVLSTSKRHLLRGNEQGSLYSRSGGEARDTARLAYLVLLLVEVRSVTSDTGRAPKE